MPRRTYWRVPKDPTQPIYPVTVDDPSDYQAPPVSHEEVTRYPADMRGIEPQHREMAAWAEPYQPSAGLLATVANIFTGKGYKPEQHYMRGPGPATAAKRH